jgi:adenylate kinase
MRRILLLGQHGAGKSTLGHELERREGAVFLSAGELIRGAIAADPSSQRAMASALENGEGVPVDFSYGLLARELGADTPQRDIILDGYPRQVGQIARLCEVLGGPPDGAVVLDVPTEVLVHRLRTRLACVDCHDIYGESIRPVRPETCDHCGGSLVKRPEDDDVEIILRRHSAWRQDGETIVQAFQAMTTVVRLDATPRPNEVIEHFIDLLGR